MLTPIEALQTNDNEIKKDNRHTIKHRIMSAAIGWRQFLSMPWRKARRRGGSISEITMWVARGRRTLLRVNMRTVFRFAYETNGKYGIDTPGQGGEVPPVDDIVADFGNGHAAVGEPRWQDALRPDPPPGRVVAPLEWEAPSVRDGGCVARHRHGAGTGIPASPIPAMYAAPVATIAVGFSNGLARGCRCLCRG